MTDEKPKISRSVLGKEYPLREAYNPKGLTAATQKEPTQKGTSTEK